MAPVPPGLVLTDAQTLKASVLESFMAIVGTSTTLSSISVVTQSGSAGGRLALPSSSIDVVLSLAETPGHHTAAFLAELARVLQPGGRLVLQEPVGRRSVAPEEAEKLGAAVSSLQTQAGLERALLLAGFSGAAVTAPVAESALAPHWTGVTPASIGSTKGALLQPIAIKAQKPSWETGKSFSLKKRASTALQAPSPATPAVSVVSVTGTRVKLSLDEVDEVTGSAQGPAMTSGATAAAAAASWTAGRDDLDDDLVDEDALLTAEDLAPPAAVPAGDCGDGKVGKKACKNCTCGRAEMEEKAVTQKLTIDQISNPQSACGSCGLGDAFRCAGCPYRGLPAFKLGEKIALSSDLLRADV